MRTVINSIFLYSANIISSCLPQSRFFAIRRLAYKLAGVRVAQTAKINGLTRVHYANVSIGEGTWIGAGTQLIPTRKSSIQIGDNCDLGPQVMFVAGSHIIGGSARRAAAGTSSPISVGAGTRVGARATFIAGSSVGSGCIVAAGSLVKDQFGDDVLIAGIPARVIRELNAEGNIESEAT